MFYGFTVKDLPLLHQIPHVGCEEPDQLVMQQPETGQWQTLSPVLYVSGNTYNFIWKTWLDI
jgi:hypothetical protein